MKKKILFCLLGIMLLAMCVGCGKKDDKKNETAPTNTPAPTATTAPTPTDTPAPTPEPTEVPTPPAVALREIYAEHGLKVGTCLTTQMIGNKMLSKLIVEQFSSVTMENDMKPDYILNQKKSQEAGDIVVEFSANAIKMLDWAKENGMAVRGHTLVWYSQTPSWIFHEDFDNSKPKVTREVMLQRMDSYFKQVFALLQEKGYSDLFYAYDVVNEAWMENGTMRNNDWKAIIGDDYLWQAFYYANKYAPENIQLFYNDYNEQFKTDALEKFVKTLVDENGNYLIDGIGFQAHLYTLDDQVKYFQTVDQLAALGLTIEMTELDVCLGKYQHPQKATDENLAIQGQYYYNLINGLFDRIDKGTLKMDAITYWGFSDGMSWRKEYSPLLYDGVYRQKPAYYGAAQLKDFAGFDAEQ